MTMFTKLCTVLLALVAMNALPTQAVLDCTGMMALEECMRPNDSVIATGQFVCRRRWNNGRVKSQSLCIAKTWGKVSDRCGCCNGNCPSVCGQACPNPVGGPVGQLGVWLYDWDSYRPKRSCVSPGRSLQQQQQNSQRWKCVEYPGWFYRIFGSHYKEDGSYDMFGGLWP